jgi:trk system potassium uptake protein TrkA
VAEFAIIGLGRFGRAVARSLVREGQAVLAVDVDAERLAQIADEVDATSRTDTTDEDAMAALRLDRMSSVVVTIGSRATEASLLTVAILRELGVPRIVARAFDERHARVLLAIGANEVMNPEEDIGESLARQLARPGILGQLDLGSERIAEVEAPEAHVGSTLAELDLAGRHRLAVLLIRRGDVLLPNPSEQERIVTGDVLVVVGEEQAIRSLADLR